jgi:hypothetical protein
MIYGTEGFISPPVRLSRGFAPAAVPSLRQLVPPVLLRVSPPRSALTPSSAELLRPSLTSSTANDGPRRRSGLALGETVRANNFGASSLYILLPNFNLLVLHLSYSDLVWY